MARTKTGPSRRRWHKKIFKLVKGYWGTRKHNYRRANEAMIKAHFYAYRDRRQRKRDLRRLWIVRINAAARLNGTSYSKLMYGLKNANVDIDRKMLADIAVRDAATFTKIVALSMQNPSPAQRRAVSVPAPRLAASLRSPAPEAVVSAPVAELRSAAPKAAAPAPAAAAAPAPVEAAPAPEAVKAAPKSRKGKKEGDDLLVIEGLGPKSDAALRAAGINTYEQVAAMTGEDLYEIVAVRGGVKLVAGQSDTWPKQARFLAAGDQEGFQAYIDKLVGGREPE